MSLTSYRAAPPRVGVWYGVLGLVPGWGFGPRLGVWSPVVGWIGRPGGDLLSRALRHSTMGAGDFHVRVRDGIGCRLPAMATRSSNPPCRGDRVRSRFCCCAAVCGCLCGSRARHAAAARRVRSAGASPRHGAFGAGKRDDLGMISMHGVGFVSSRSGD
jgi:hypothetical protein